MPTLTSHAIASGSNIPIPGDGSFSITSRRSVGEPVASAPAIAPSVAAGTAISSASTVIVNVT
jgi:hypothetical protein